MHENGGHPAYQRYSSTGPPATASHPAASNPPKLRSRLSSGDAQKQQCDAQQSLPSLPTARTVPTHANTRIGMPTTARIHFQTYQASASAGGVPHCAKDEPTPPHEADHTSLQERY